jgi:uncharacterized membrane protein
MCLDEIARRIASLGLPAVIFAVACSIAAGMGLAGGAVITTALAMLGGPFGMVVGLGVLGVSTIIGDAVATYGIEELLVAVYNIYHRSNGRPCSELIREINSLWLSDELRRRIINRVGCHPQ